MRDRESRLYFTFMDPKAASTAKQLKMYDKWAVDEIKRAEEHIRAIKEYRLELAARMQALETMTRHTRITLERIKHWRGNVEYYLRTEEVFEDETTRLIESINYSGKERHKAIKDYNTALKLHPGCEAVKDIEKGKWE